MRPPAQQADLEMGMSEKSGSNMYQWTFLPMDPICDVWFGPAASDDVIVGPLLSYFGKFDPTAVWTSDEIPHWIRGTCAGNPDVSW